MKTAITVLQEMMMKIGETPEYECISQSGPQHMAMFEYQCRARGESATATARSKKEAKQEAARALLQRLAAAGAAVPPPFGRGPEHPQSGGAAAAGGAGGAAGASVADTRSYVALLKELCEEYKLPAVEYELVGDTGPPHLRHFTVRTSIGQHTRLATATTKKAARQAAAEALYHYLRENLKLTRDFVEEEALVRAHEKAMSRYRETREEHLHRPPLAQRPADYHLGLHEQFDESARTLALEALESTRSQPGEVALGCVTAALGLEAAWASLPREAAPPLHVVTLSPAAPPLAFAGATRDAAAAAAARYLRRALPAVAAADVADVGAADAATAATAAASSEAAAAGDPGDLLM